MIAARTWKEKELSDKKAGAFTKLVFQPRIYQTSCEGNMKTLIFTYQTITKMRDVLTKILMNISQKGYLRTSMDFQSWNHEVLEENLVFLDDVFRLKSVYANLHIIAERITVLFLDKACNPEIKSD